MEGATPFTVSKTLTSQGYDAGHWKYTEGFTLVLP
jgi:hypothetical protein